jgi:single-stranded DNA-binding protein
LFSYATSSSSSTTQSGFEEHEGQKSSSNKTEASSVNPPQFGSSFNNSTSSSRNGTHNGFEQCHIPTSSANTSQAASPNQPEDLFGAAVHILPETLVNGAVNVASQAYTTARSVLNNLGFGSSEVSM